MQMTKVHVRLTRSLTPLCATLQLQHRKEHPNTWSQEETGIISSSVMTCGYQVRAQNSHPK